MNDLIKVIIRCTSHDTFFFCSLILFVYFFCLMDLLNVPKNLLIISLSLDGFATLIYYSWQTVKNLYKLFSTHFLLQVLGKLGELGHLPEEKLVMECLPREPLNQSCLLKMIFLTPYVLRVPSQKAMAPQGEKAF